MSCHQSIQYQRLRTTHELYSPWWSPLAQWRRRNEGWLRQRLRYRRNPSRRSSISVEDEKLGGRREPNVSEEHGENEDNAVDDAALQLTLSSNRAFGSDSRDDNTLSPNNVPIRDTTSASNTTSKSNNDSKSDVGKGMQHNSNKPEKSSEQAATKIRGGGADISRNISCSGAHQDSSPSTLDSEAPSKTWVSRFKNTQKSNKSRRRRNRTQSSTSLNGLRFALHKREYRNLGIEFSYTDMTRAEFQWKLQSLTIGNGNLRKPKPGRSNLRYCLSYSMQAIDTVSAVGNIPWNKYRQWFSLRRTARAAASCMGL
ncbi:predicted protein [Sclerotinia sclerotiorum 1980 UF-70]|uniref:Uncharacterized protein n=2 Tax=Sclerotinia sclerotiorum (strain ATCC 18683 / 1980 / Ss-1) TaxID=665079 RepID=A7E821_SCLS1|nr:predicted protein [Sclerotinia sclerotiorum 1980 UF-70]APA06108.1 hypothetical protein sscle_01g008780 [Sclerotinia sclerotiorum 1980 UF-70]EDN96523.1 predicted protein [Sclerotinia sclerotiorum 1980 UF-70]